MSNAEVAQMVEYERTQLVELRKQNASQGEISYQMQKIRQAEINQEEVKLANTRAERTAETAAFGMVAGTTLGAAVGSIFPVVGTMLGGMIGGVLGQWGGSVLSEYANNQEEQRRKEIQNIPVGSVSEFRRMDEENLAQYRDEGYQNQLTQEKKERDAREVERVFKENAEGIRRHHYADYLKRHD